MHSQPEASMRNNMYEAKSGVCFHSNFHSLMFDLFVYSSNSSTQYPSLEKATMTKPIHKTEKEWEALLTPKQFYVLRQKGTEMAGTGARWSLFACEYLQCMQESMRITSKKGCTIVQVVGQHCISLAQSFTLVVVGLPSTILFRVYLLSDTNYTVQVHYLSNS